VIFRDPTGGVPERTVQADGSTSFFSALARQLLGNTLLSP
jgi:hypothetical protein